MGIILASTSPRRRELMERMGLDFYTPTEHNAIHTGWPVRTTRR